MRDGEQAAQQSGAKPPATPSSDKKDSSSLGNALRAVYHDAASEAVPDEMLDLLSKLK
ncbi:MULTISPECIES: NepR family anti-sigma factor [unclassified Sphingomonas]|uniref:NepR family anti-sigma factor n=1 Tax=unclassified Sphingomonas TaxID=196159 RepID=UPI000AF3543C|nr:MULTISPECIES: NepR family anti-sigma factor [unclassified Sphingomonas]